MVRTHRETRPLNAGAEEEGGPHHREALLLCLAVVPLGRVEGATEVAHGSRGLVGLLLQQDHSDLPRARVGVHRVSPMSPR